MNSKYSQNPDDNTLSQTVKALNSNGIATQVVNDEKAAKDTVINLIPKRAQILTATSVTLEKTGIASFLNESGEYDAVRPKLYALMGDPANRTEMRRIGASPEYVIGSVHALTQDGKLLIASATGSQLASEVYGAEHVIYVVGAQKIVKNFEEGLKRIHEYSFLLEDERANKAYGRGTSFNKLLVLNKEAPGRIQVVIIKQNIGF